METAKTTRDETVRTSGAKTASFSSTMSSYVALLGYTVGMTDFWRFAFLVYRNGGGAFFIPFLLTIFLCGIPLFFLEYSISNFSGKGPYLLWDICPLFRGIGATLAAAYIAYMAGTSIFRGWLAVFLVHSFKDPLPWTHCNNEWNTELCRSNQFVNVTSNTDARLVYTDHVTYNQSIMAVNLTNSTEKKFMTAAEEFWQFESLGLSSGLTDFGGMKWQLVLFIALLRLLVFLCTFKSIASIEKVMYLLLFAPLMFMMAVLVQSLTLPGATDGLYKFFYPEFSKLSEPRIWIEAFLMVFYTLAFGWGGILTLGSHSNFRDNCVRTSLWIPILDALFGILNGAVCFSVLGNMAHIHGVAIEDVLTTGFAAGVVSYVTSLAALPFPQIWSAAFFVTAIMAGLDSQVIPVEMCVQIVGEAYPKLYPRYRLHVLTAVSVLLFVLALPTCTGAGGYMFLWCDWYVGVWVGPIVAFVEVVTVAWIYGLDRFNQDVQLMTGRPLPGYFRFTVSFVAPVLVVIIFLTACVEYVPPKYGEYHYPSWARGLGWATVALIMSPIVITATSRLKDESGSIVKRIKTSIEELPSWGPKDSEARLNYRSKRSLYANRPLTRKLRYMLTGNDGLNREPVDKDELATLNSK